MDGGIDGWRVACVKMYACVHVNMSVRVYARARLCV